MNTLNTLITPAYLRSRRAFEPHIAIFEAIWPEGFDALLVDVPETAAKITEAKLDIEWASENLLTPEGRAEYEKVTAPAWAEYDRVVAPARAEYEKVTAPALAEYKKVTAPAWAEYEKVATEARAEYEKVTTEARAEYEKVATEASAEYEKVTAAAWAEYEKVATEASAEYEKVTDAAWAEYDRVTAEALAEYEKVRAAAGAEYEKVTAPSWAEYEKVTAPSWAEYEKVRAVAGAEASAEYEKVATEASAEYEKVTAEAFLNSVRTFGLRGGYVNPDQLDVLVKSYRAFVENIARSNVPLHLVGDAMFWTGWGSDPSVNNAILHISPSASAFMDWCEVDDRDITIEATPEVLSAVSSNMAFYACYMDVVMWRARAHEINCPAHTPN